MEPEGKPTAATEPVTGHPNRDNPAVRPRLDARGGTVLGTAGAATMLLFVAGDYVGTPLAIWSITAIIAAATVAVVVLQRRGTLRARISPAPTPDGAPGAKPLNSPLATHAATSPPPLADSGVPRRRRAATGAPAWFDLRQVAHLALQGTDSPDSNRFAYRIDAGLPERALACEESLSGLLRALATVARGEKPCCLYLDTAGPGRTGIEFEIRRKTAGNAGIPAPALAAAEALAQDLGGHLKHHPEIGTLAVDGGFELDAVAPGETAAPIRFPGRALFVVNDQTWEALNAGIALPPRGQCVAVSSFDAAAREFALSIRRGNPYSVILAACDLVFQPQALAPARAFGRHCAVANVPFYLLGEPRPNRDFLHELGYAGWLAELDGAALRRAMLTTPPVTTDRTDNVVPVAPWLWGRQRDRRRVLVVDDMRTTRLIVSDILKANGYDVESVDNAEAALHHLTQGNLSLAIIDLHMPGTDGITLLQRYHQADPAERVPILILTANTTKIATQECAAAGADAYLTKPIHSENLLGVVRTLIAEDDLRRYGDRRTPATDSPESPPLIERDAFRGIAHFVPVAEIVRQFHSETSDILAQFEQALRERRFDACTDQARSLRTCALAVGASALACAAEKLESLGAEQLEQAGAAGAADLRLLLSASIEAMTHETR
jgi:CheY-like chemotaxis protein